MFKLKLYLWLNGLFLALIWGAMLFMSKETINLLIMLFAIENLISLAYLRYVLDEQVPTRYKGFFGTYSIVQLVFALGLLLFPGIWRFLMSLLVVIFAIGIIGIGIVMIRDALQIKRAGITSWTYYFLLWIIVLLLGAFILTNSVLTIILLEKLLGLSILINGISLIIRGFKITNQPSRQTIRDETDEDEE